MDKMRILRKINLSGCAQTAIVLDSTAAKGEEGAREAPDGWEIGTADGSPEWLSVLAVVSHGSGQTEGMSRAG